MIETDPYPKDLLHPYLLRCIKNKQTNKKTPKLSSTGRINNSRWSCNLCCLLVQLYK